MVHTRQSPSELIEGEISGLEAPVTLVRLAARLVLEEAPKAENRNAQGRDDHARGVQPGRGTRNGNHTGRLKTAEGSVEFGAPQTASQDKPFRSRICSELRGHTERLEALAVEMQGPGQSVRDIEDVFRDETGSQLLSRTVVSETGERLWQDTQDFCRRDLGDYDIACLFVDGITERVRPSQRCEAVLAAWGITSEGRKVLLGLAAGSREDTDTVSTVFEKLKGCNPRDLPVGVSDGMDGIIKAIEVRFPRLLRQRCLMHRTRNLRDKLPDDLWPEFKARTQVTRLAPSWAISQDLVKDLARESGGALPTAVACFDDNFEACMARFRVPVSHRRAVQSTNRLECLFVEERRRLKIIPDTWTRNPC